MHGKLVMFGDETLTCVTSRLLVQRQQMTGLSSFSFHIFLDYLFIQISREDGGRTFCVGLLRLVHHLGCSLINSNIPPPPLLPLLLLVLEPQQVAAHRCPLLHDFLPTHLPRSPVLLAACLMAGCN